MRYEIVHPFQAEGKRWNGEDATQVHRLPRDVRAYYVRQGNIREIPPEPQPETTSAPAAAKRPARKQARTRAAAAPADAITTKGSDAAPADKE